MATIWQWALVACSSALFANAQYRNITYFQPNSTGLRTQHGFEPILIQPFGYDGFRVRAWPYRPPTGDEISFLYDSTIEGPESGKAVGLSYDKRTNGSEFVAVRNGNTIVKTLSATADITTNVRLSFYRVAADGAETLLTNEYSPPKQSAHATTPGTELDMSSRQPSPSRPHRTSRSLARERNKTTSSTRKGIKGYAFTWNSAAEGAIEFGQQRNRFTSKSTTLVDYITSSAPSGHYDTLQRRLSALIGRAPMLPDWSLGYLHSKLRYENQSKFIHLAQNFLDYEIPVSILVIDDLSWARQGDWSLDAGLWPNNSYMAQRVKEPTGAEIMGSLWPSVEDASVNYEPMQIDGFLSATRSGPGNTDSFNGSYIRNYDATNPKARSFLWDTLKKKNFDNDIKNFWIDQADGGSRGEAYENNGQFSFLQSLPWPLADVLYYAGTQMSVGKLYPRAHQQAIEDGLRNATDSNEGEPRDYISLSRSATSAPSASAPSSVLATPQQSGPHFPLKSPVPFRQ